MKLLFKIILICVIIFSLSIVIAKISIDRTFKQVECDQLDKALPYDLTQKTEQV